MNSESFIDSCGYLFDDEERWISMEHQANSGRLNSMETLDDARESCRQLALTNEFAINGHENRISYVVGKGHRFSVEAKPGVNISKSIVTQADKILCTFLEKNRWFERQQEIMRRKDRDGEVFLRLFASHDGQTCVRFVEPEQVYTPQKLDFCADGKTLRNRLSSNPRRSVCRFGIQTSSQDVEDVQGYWVDEKFVPASEIQHRKANVDFNVLRGVPLFYPVRKNLRRAEKLLRNMSVVAEIQSAIAIIRKHAGGTKLGVENFARQTATPSPYANPATPSFTRRYSPGTILDTSAGVEYQFPVAAVDASRYILVLQAELRAIASRLVIPEFMLTSDASNSNYSSTMIAEGPAVRMFERLQREMIEDDLRLIRHVFKNAVFAGKTPSNIFELISVHITPPTLCVRNRIAEVEADKLLVELGAMSVAELAARHACEQKYM